MSKSLYDRLGGRDGITRLVDDIMAAHLANPLIKTRFEGIADMARARTVTIEFFCAGAGGPEAYTGRDMRAAHRGMNISEQEYLAATDDVMGALDRNQVDEQSRKDILAILYGLKGEILRV